MSVSQPTLRSSTLYKYLVSIYSLGSAARQAELFLVIFQTNLAKDTDPNPHLAKIKGAYNDVVAVGQDLKDSALVQAMPLSLPPSYSTIVQSFYLAFKPTSAEVVAAIRTEW